MTPDNNIGSGGDTEVKVVVWTATKAEEAGFPDFLPEGTFRSAVAVQIGQDGKAINPILMPGVTDLMGLDLSPEYAAGVLASAKLLFAEKAKNNMPDRSLDNGD